MSAHATSSADARKIPLLRASAALELTVQSIWTTIANLPGPRPRRVLFTAPRQGEGTTTIAACTAIALCRNLRTRVALLEANPFRPALAAYAACDPTPGLAEVLRTEIAGDEALRGSFEAGLSLLPAGTLKPREPIDWGGPNVRRLLENGLRDFPYAIIDAPPLLDRPVGRILFKYCDHAVLVVRAGVTTKPDTREALQIIRDAGVSLAGTVLNRA